MTLPEDAIARRLLDQYALDGGGLEVLASRVPGHRARVRLTMLLIGARRAAVRSPLGGSRLRAFLVGVRARRRRS